jgi:hypothetical protein
MHGLMSGDGKRGAGHRPQATAPILDSTRSAELEALGEPKPLQRNRCRKPKSQTFRGRALHAAADGGLNNYSASSRFQLIW